MDHLVLILLFLLIGVALRLSGRLPQNTTKVLGGWVINVALPATALKSVHEVSVDGAWIFAAATPWIGAILAIAVFVTAGRQLGWSRQRVGGLILVSGWGNTSFVGLPLIAAFAGDEWLGLGLFIDLFGSYLALSTLGMVVAVMSSERALSIGAIVRRVLTFPPFLAIILALATNHLDRPPWIETSLDALAATMTPLALAAVGFAIRLDRLAGQLTVVAGALSFRLLVAPAALLGLYLVVEALQIVPYEPAVRQVTILEMAMPPMLGATIIALDHDLEPDLVANVIGIGIPISILTTFLWWQFLTGG